MERINIQGMDGASITACTRVPAEGQVKGVVIICHGFGEHAGGYSELADRLAQSGYASVVFDQRGHGDVPPKNRGVIPSYASFLNDIECVAAEMRRQMPDAPLVLYGHSMGGNIAVNYLLRRGQRMGGICCAVLESPWLGLHNKVSPALERVARFIGNLSPKPAIINKIPPDDVTGDAKKAECLKKDTLYHNRISFRLFSGVSDACAFALNNAADLSVPTFLAVASRDRVVSNDAIRIFNKAAAKVVTMKEYDSCHMIHNDAQGDAFLSDMIAFMDGHCGASQ